MFRTELQIQPSPAKFSIQDTIVSIGSCFADDMGLRLVHYKMDCLYNPCGIIYNPYSICKVLDYAINRKMPEQSTYLRNDEVYSNFDFHSRISDVDPNKLQGLIERSLNLLNTKLIKARWLILTFGTAVVYSRKDNQQIVANCHKVPATEFSKGILTQKQILSVFMHTYKSLMAINPGINFLLTVSPVRHIKDTLEINSVSKSILRITCDTLKNELENVYYFPSYEIMIDDLRDYRFYGDDLVHPNRQALNYIWEKFIESYMDKPLQEFVREWKEISLNLSHRPFHPTTKSHRKFLANTLEKLKNLSKLVNVEAEIAELEKQLNDK